MLFPLQNTLGPLGRTRLAGRGVQPLHSWTLDDTYVDVEGAGWTWAPQAGTPTFEAGVRNNAVRCTQSPSKGNLLITPQRTVTAIDGGESFSVMGWFKANQAASSPSILYAFGWSPIGNLWFLDNNNGQNESEFFVAGVSGSISAKGPYISNVGVWVFMAGTFDLALESSVLYYGIDGAALQTVAGVKSGWVGPRKANTSVDLRSCYFTVGDVTVDETRIFDLALEAADVQAYYDLDKP